MVGTSDIPDWCFVEIYGKEGKKYFSESPSVDDLCQFHQKSPISHISEVHVRILHFRIRAVSDIYACESRVCTCKRKILWMLWIALCLMNLSICRSRHQHSFSLERKISEFQFLMACRCFFMLLHLFMGKRRPLSYFQLSKYLPLAFLLLSDRNFGFGHTIWQLGIFFSLVVLLYMVVRINYVFIVLLVPMRHLWLRRPFGLPLSAIYMCNHPWNPY